MPSPRRATLHRPPPSVLAPIDPLRYAPSRERPVRTKRRRLEKHMQVAPHRHDWAQVAICAAGAARITAGAGTYLVPASRAVWIPPGLEHQVTAVEAAELVTLYVHQDAETIGPGVPAHERQTWQRCRVLEVSPLLRELALQLDVADDAPAAHERERRLTELALDELRRAAPLRLGLTLPQDKRLRALCEAVLADPQRHATLEAWADAVGASPRTLARLFREQLDTSFGPWRQQALLAHALTLAARGRPMGLIAAELGYASASAFSAMVRRAVGQPPRRFFADAAGR